MIIRTNIGKSYDISSNGHQWKKDINEKEIWFDVSRYKLNHILLSYQIKVSFN